LGRQAAAEFQLCGDIPLPPGYAGVGKIERQQQAKTMHPIVMQELVKARQSDLSREADQSRLARKARAGQSGLIDIFLWGFGNLLIGTGVRLKKRRSLQRSGVFASPHAAELGVLCGRTPSC